MSLNEAWFDPEIASSLVKNSKSLWVSRYIESSYKYPTAQVPRGCLISSISHGLCSVGKPKGRLRQFRTSRAQMVKVRLPLCRD